MLGWPYSCQTSVKPPSDLNADTHKPNFHFTEDFKHSPVVATRTLVCREHTKARVEHGFLPHNKENNCMTTNHGHFLRCPTNLFFLPNDSVAHRASSRAESPLASIFFHHSTRNRAQPARPDPNMDAKVSDQILALVPADDRKAMRVILGDVSPAKEGFENYITDLEERCVLFSQLQQLHQQLQIPLPTAATLGFMMVAPISEIRVHLSNLHTSPKDDAYVWANGTDTAALGAISDCKFLHHVALL